MDVTQLVMCRLAHPMSWDADSCLTNVKLTRVSVEGCNPGVISTVLPEQNCDCKLRHASLMIF